MALQQTARRVVHDARALLLASVAVLAATARAGSLPASTFLSTAFPIGPSPGGRWGASLSMYDHAGEPFWLASGAPNLNVGDGAAYVHQYFGPVTGWVKSVSFMPDGAAERLGTAVVVTNSTVAVGAPFADNHLGAVYVYGITNYGNGTASGVVTWARIARLVQAAPNGAECGTALASSRSERILVVGCPSDATDAPNGGKVYVMGRTGASAAAASYYVAQALLPNDPQANRCMPLPRAGRVHVRQYGSALNARATQTSVKSSLLTTMACGLRSARHKTATSLV